MMTLRHTSGMMRGHPLPVAWCAVATMLAACLATPALRGQPRLDPAAWGGDHVGKPVPQFTSGDECLFCHRDVGPAWPKNQHGLTIRELNPPEAALVELGRLPQLKSFAGEVELLLGSRNQVRFLKRSAEQGRLDMLSAKFIPPNRGEPSRLNDLEHPHWDTKTFGARCAGCHSTGVDSAKQAFAAHSLDCFVCHGELTEKHTTQGSLVFLSPRRRDSPAVVTSICGQCHLRGGVSKSSGLPYPSNFVAGDNLFRDFRVDLSDATIDAQNPADRHIQQNIRDVVLLGADHVTCLSCHNIHQQSARQHHTLADSKLCLTCHAPNNKKSRIPYEVHSTTCDY